MNINNEQKDHVLPNSQLNHGPQVITISFRLKVFYIVENMYVVLRSNSKNICQAWHGIFIDINDKYLLDKDY